MIGPRSQIRISGTLNQDKRHVTANTDVFIQGEQPFTWKGKISSRTFLEDIPRLYNFTATIQRSWTYSFGKLYSEYRARVARPKLLLLDFDCRSVFMSVMLLSSVWNQTCSEGVEEYNSRRICFTAQLDRHKRQTWTYLKGNCFWTCDQLQEEVTL